MAQENVIWINFHDKAIDKLFIKSGNRITVKFKNVKVPYLNGLILRYSPLTQKKRFYSKYKHKGKTKWLKLNEFLLDHYGTVEVSEELLKLYKLLAEEEMARKRDPSRYGGMIRGARNGIVDVRTPSWKNLFETPKTEYDEALEDAEDTPGKKYYW